MSDPGMIVNTVSSPKSNGMYSLSLRNNFTTSVYRNSKYLDFQIIILEIYRFKH